MELQGCAGQRSKLHSGKIEACNLPAMTATATAPTGIMGRLKAETAEQHAVAEAKPLEAALIGGSIAHDQYKEYLAQRWLIHRELEAATDVCSTKTSAFPVSVFRAFTRR